MALLVNNSLESSLKDIRITIIGDDDIKNSFINSGKLEELLKILDSIVMSADVNDDVIEKLQHILIILNSLTYHSTNWLNEYNILNKLIFISCKFQDFEEILTITLKILANLLSKDQKNNHNINDLLLQNYSQGENFKSLLLLKINQFDTLHSNALFLQIFRLIPQLNPTILQSLLPSLIKIMETLLEVPKAILIKKYKNQKIFLECYDCQILPTPPSLRIFSVLLTPLLYSISHLLNLDHDSILANRKDDSALSDTTKVLMINQLIDQDLYFTISSLLKTTNAELKLSAITVLVHFSLNSNLSKNIKNSNVLKILPSLIQLIDATLTSSANFKNPLNGFKSEYKLSRNFNPFYMLSKLCLNFEFVNDFLINCNIIRKFCEILKSFNLIEDITNVSIIKLDNLSDFFLILSSITSNNEKNRNLIIDNDLIQVLDKILKNHHKVLTNHIQGKTNDIDLLILSNHLTLSTLYLLRSLSRSVAILRTYLSETSVVEKLLELIRLDEVSIENMVSGLKLTDTVKKSIVNDEVLLKSVIVSIITNLVLDFSPLRSVLLIKNGLVSIISHILNTTKYPALIFNSLWCLRHIVYNETPDNKDNYLSKIGLGKLFEYIINEETYQDEGIEEQCFTVLRNFTCNSEKHVNLILDYKPYEGFNFLDFLNKKLMRCLDRREISNGFLESIVFIVTHIAAIDEKKRDLIINEKPLLENIKTILALPKVKNDVKLGCIWMLINLTWIENPVNRDFYGDDNDDDDDDGGDEISVEEEEEDDDGEGDDYDGEEARGRGREGEVYEAEDGGDINDEEGDVIPEQRGASLPAARDARFVRNNGVYSGMDTQKRVDFLNSLGFREVLTELLRDEGHNSDLKERINTILFNLNRNVS